MERVHGQSTSSMRQTTPERNRRELASGKSAPGVRHCISGLTTALQADRWKRRLTLAVGRIWEGLVPAPERAGIGVAA